MDITVVDYFRSKYVMNQPDVFELLDVQLVNEVKNNRNILRINDPEERKHQEALILWRRVPINVRTNLVNQFNAWIGNIPDSQSEEEIIGAEPYSDDDDSDSDSSVKELEQKSLEKKYHKKEKKENTRRLTVPIYRSKNEESLLGLVTPVEQKGGVLDMYRTIFTRLVSSGEVNIIWDNIKVEQYGNKNEKNFAFIRHVFSNISYYQRHKFKDVFPKVMYVVHTVLMSSGIYDEYPDFKDYKNLAGHIVLKGKDYCTSIVDDTNKVRDLLEYDNFHPIWDHYKKTL